MSISNDDVFATGTAAGTGVRETMSLPGLGRLKTFFKAGIGFEI